MKFTEARLEFTDVTLEHVIRALDTAGLQLLVGSVVIVHTEHWSKLNCRVSSAKDDLYLFDCHWTYGVNERPGGMFEQAVRRVAQEPELTLVNGR